MVVFCDAMKVLVVSAMSLEAIMRRAIVVGAAATMIGTVAWLMAAGFEPSGREQGERVPPPLAGSTAIACNANEPGERLLIAGRVIDDAGAAVSNAAVIAYGTDASGLYNPRNSPTREPRLQATVHTDAEGRFQVLTVMPGPYPESDDPAHIHFDIKAAGFGVHYSAMWFKGDTRINEVTTARAKDWERRHPNDVTRVEEVVKDERGVKFVEHVITISKQNQ